jgi:hypothetical protein
MEQISHNRISKLINKIMLIMIGLMCQTAGAATPLWTLIPAPGSNPTQTVSVNGTATVQYVVQNQSAKPKKLVLKPMQGISQSAPCKLASGSRCILTLIIKGSALPKSGIHGGPALCQANSDGSPNPNQCYQPSSANSLNITRRAFTFPSAAVTVGNYRQGLQSFPLSYILNDSDLSWVENSPAPLGNGDTLSSVSCNGGSCVAVGYYLSSGIQQPSAYTSNDNGLTWIPSLASPPPQGVGNNFLLDVSCNASGYCVTVGNYLNGGSSEPLTYYSINSGQSWAASIPNVVAGSIGSNLNGVWCNNFDVCVTVGNSYDGTIFSPLTYTSDNGGVDWAESLPTPQSAGNNSLTDVACNTGGSCLAVGSYVNGSQILPLSYSSTNFGQTWDPVNTGFAIGDDSVLLGVSCSGNTCVAVGRFKPVTLEQPLVLITNNFGQAWNFSFPAVQGNGDNSLSDVSCNNAGNCIAVGNYVDNGQNLALSYSSIDLGQSWDVTSPSPQGAESFLLGVSLLP